MMRWLLALSIVATTSALSVKAQSNDLQLARLNPQAGFETQLGDLYGPLSVRSANLYQQIFDVQKDGHWRHADKLISQLPDKLLLGHVQAQRYLHPTKYRSSFEELANWMADNADHPQAPTIYKLAMKRMPKGASKPAKPVKGYLGGSGQELLQEQPSDYESPLDRSVETERTVEAWLAKIKGLVSRDRPTQATKLLGSRTAKLSDAVEYDLAQLKIARGYFANLKDEKALTFARAAAKRSGTIEPRMHWTAGMAAWRLGKVELAAKHFSALAQSNSPGAEIAKGAFWAARAYQAMKNFDKHQTYLTIASNASDEFYGQLAQKIIGVSSDFEWHEEGLRGELRGMVARFPATRRAMALAQSGQSELAAKEIRKLAARAKPELAQALAALAESLSLPAAQMRVAQRLRLLDGRRHDGALYPLPPWEPQNGFEIDRALLFALARAESGFNPNARSHADARGIMQILPSTARMVAKKYDIAYNGPSQLYDPELNLDLGQAYIDRLLGNHLINGSLIHLVIAYNAGLKRLDAWVPRFRDFDDDPLLFLESIPIPETREYTKKVMSNLWAYRARLDQESYSLDQLANAKWPIYKSSVPGRDYAWAD